MFLTLAIDAMGGDLGPAMVVPGLEMALKNLSAKNVHFLLYGDESIIHSHIKHYPVLKSLTTVIHTDVIITSETKPTAAVRQGRKSNIGMAVDAVKSGQAQAVVSAGNTGAYMALSKIILKTLDGIDRPAIPAIMPTTNRHGKTLVLDLGANIDCSALNLIQFALMGEAFAKLMFDIENPTVGLLNVGSEEMKGHSTVQEAFKTLRAMPDINFHGFVEGDDIMTGTTDVVVTDGFTGNIALKSIEGTSRFISNLMKKSIESSWRGKVGYFVAKPAFDKIRTLTDARQYNGAVFLGLRHIAVKSHGGADSFAFSKAVEVAAKMAAGNFIEKVQQRLNASNSNPN